MKRAEIPGQEDLKNVMVRLVDQSKLPHALMLHGLEGGVSLPLALFLTQYLLCDDREGGDACGVCPSCTKVEGFTHPDVHFIVPVNTSKSVKREHLCTDKYLDEWRSALKENPFLSLREWYPYINIEKSQGYIGDNEGKELRKKLALRAYEGKKKVFIVWHADRMNPVFGNKVLKSLEEPSDDTLFLLVTEHPNQLLTTIASRVQRFQEAPISDQEVAAFLSTRYNLDQGHAMNYAFRAEGNVNQAIREALQKEDPWLEAFREWMRAAFRRDLIALYTWSEGMARNNRDTQRQFIEGALKMLNRCFRMGWLDLPLPMEGEEADFFKKFSPYVNSANVHGFMELLEEASFHIERNVNEKVVWYDSSIKAIRLVHAGKKALAG